MVSTSWRRGARRRKVGPLMARPKKLKADLKDITIKIRVTSEQRRRLQEAADGEGLEVSGWIRLVALRQATRRKESK